MNSLIDNLKQVLLSCPNISMHLINIIRPQNWYQYSKIIWRKIRFKKCSFIFIALIIFLFFNQLIDFYLLIKCWTLKYKALNQMCKSYQDGEFIGLSCSKFCTDRSVELTDCPNIQYHRGKDYVFNVRDRSGDEYIIKSREPHLSTKEFTKDLLIHSISQLIKETFKGDLNVSEIQNLIYLNRPINLQNLNNQDFVTLANLYNLLQDNEYTLSMILNNVNRFKSLKTLPSISTRIATCGNWYTVDKVRSIVDYSYLERSGHSTKDKLSIGVSLMKFLVKFEAMNIDLELCDSKYEHFGFFERNPISGNISDELVLIDSDMIYHRINVKENIGAIQNCQKDEDCDFVDCKGVCSRLANQTSICNLNTKDNNLKRMCLNLFYLEPFQLNQLYDANSLGLLVNLDRDVEQEVKLIYELCFNDDLINERKGQIYLYDERIDSISAILLRMLSRS